MATATCASAASARASSELRRGGLLPVAPPPCVPDVDAPAALQARHGSPATEAAGPSPDPRIPSDEAPWPNESLAAASDAAPPPPLVSPGGEVDARWDSSTAKLSRGLNDRERARAPLPIAAARRPPDWPRTRADGHAPFRSDTRRGEVHVVARPRVVTCTCIYSERVATPFDGKSGTIPRAC